MSVIIYARRNGLQYFHSNRLIRCGCCQRRVWLAARTTSHRSERRGERRGDSCCTSYWFNRRDIIKFNGVGGGASGPASSPPPSPPPLLTAGVKALDCPCLPLGAVAINSRGNKTRLDFIQWRRVNETGLQWLFLIRVTSTQRRAVGVVEQQVM